MRIWPEVLLLTAMTLIIPSCKEATPINIVEEDPQLSFSKFIHGIKSFPYHMEISRADAIFNNYYHLGENANLSRVRELFGMPDAIFYLYKKENGAKIFYGTCYSYYFYRVRFSKEDPRADESLDLYFDESGILYYQKPHNIEGYLQGRQ